MGRSGRHEERVCSADSPWLACRTICYELPHTEIAEIDVYESGGSLGDK